jgi:adenylate cyclase class 2
MYIEYEAKFTNINKDDIRAQLTKIGATLVRPEYLQRRIPFHLPKEMRSPDTWVRVRDEGNKVTMSLKQVDGDKIENQKEILLEVSDFGNAVALLEAIGCEPKSYQENKRELWTLDTIEITIDEWPFLEPFVEVEGHSEQDVQQVSEKLGFDYSTAVFGAVGKLYHLKYGISDDQINQAEKILFDMKNPFEKVS